MARSTDSIEDIINATVERVTRRILPAIERALAEAAAPRAAAPRAAAPRQGARRPAAGRRRPRTRELTRWVADKRARRVPSFVIEATGLDTKKKIVAKFGENATFERGKPLPQARTPAAEAQRRTDGGETSPPRAVKARPPVIRKAPSAQPGDRAR
jgi:hypothetical protein